MPIQNELLVQITPDVAAQIVRSDIKPTVLRGSGSVGDNPAKVEISVRDVAEIARRGNVLKDGQRIEGP